MRRLVPATLLILTSLSVQNSIEASVGERAVFTVPVEHRVVFTPTTDPARICGSPIECGKVAVTVHSPCRARLGRFDPEPKLYTHGRIHYFGAAIKFLDRRPAMDRSVRDEVSIREHVLRWHVEPALAVIEPEVVRLASRRFDGEESCQQATREASAVIAPLFFRALAETQSMEVDRIDVTAELASGKFLARFPEVPFGSGAIVREPSAVVTERQRGRGRAE